MKVLAFALVVLALACRREPAPKDRTEPWAAPGLSGSASSRPAGAPVPRARYRVEQGKVELELPAKGATPRGSVSALSGHIELAPSAPERSTGSVELDLASLVMFDDGAGAAAPERSKRALEWLGLGTGVAAVTRESARKASFIVRSLERRSTGTWLLRGELALAGVRAPESVEIAVTPALDALAEAPSRIQIRSVAPLVVSLSTHDIRPRDQHGAPIARDLELLGQKVGREARVTFVLTLAKQD